MIGSAYRSVAIGKAQVACVQSFPLWQQATIEFMRRDPFPRTLVIKLNRSQVNISKASTPQSLYYSLLLVRDMYIVVLRAHPVRGESHIQRNATREIATIRLWILKFENLFIDTPPVM